jgi:hypothetical protein
MYTPYHWITFLISLDDKLCGILSIFNAFQIAADSTSSDNGLGCLHCQIVEPICIFWVCYMCFNIKFVCGNFLVKLEQSSLNSFMA